MASCWWKLTSIGRTSTNAPTPTALADATEEALRQVLFAADAPANLPHNEFDRFYDIPSSQMMRALKRKVDELDATHAGAPPRAMAMEDKATPYNVQVFIRGKPAIAGRKCHDNFLKSSRAKIASHLPKGSGRLELAQAITDRNNPLTARVFVNRVWLHHFGRRWWARPVILDCGLIHPRILNCSIILRHVSWRMVGRSKSCIA